MREIGRIVTVTPPANPPVSVLELRTHSRIETAEEDFYLADLLDSARETVEDFTRRRLITQTVDEFFDSWPNDGVLRLGASPVQSITSVKHFDEDAVEATLTASNYVTDLYSSPPRLMLKRDYSWPSTTLREVNGVVVRYVVGYGLYAPSVPERLRHAILYLAATAHEHRENVIVGTISTALPGTAEALMWPHRVMDGMV